MNKGSLKASSGATPDESERSSGRGPGLGVKDVSVRQMHSLQRKPSAHL